MQPVYAYWDEEMLLPVVYYDDIGWVVIGLPDTSRWSDDAAELIDEVRGFLETPWDTTAAGCVLHAMRWVVKWWN